VLEKLYSHDLKMKLRILKHNFNILSGRNAKTVNKKDYHTILKVKKEGRIWSLSDKQNKVFIPDLGRWVIYQSSIGIARERLLNYYSLNLLENFSKNDIVIDIGANSGDFTVACAKIGLNTYSFEPEELTYLALKENTKKYNNVKIFQLGASDKSGETSFYVAPGTADSSLVHSKENGSQKIKIKTIRLDEFMQNNQIEKVKFFKCDAEGAEPEVLSGLGKFIKNIEYISIDCGEERDGESTLETCSLVLKESNFNILSTISGTRVILFAKNNRI